ncbi:MAG: type I methionyl aminopeptidase [Clostridia bacterium]|nr:type I methionyl aminopeptidase [Clostridia bacterium]
MITIKTPAQIEKMRKAGKLLAELFEEISKFIKPGISTLELDKFAYEYIIKHGAKPSCLHYQGYPNTICTSIDNVVVHGIPKATDILKDGMIVSVDIVLSLDGYHADATRTYLIGNVSEEKRKLVEVTKECFFEAIKGLKDGSRLGDIGARIQHHAEKHGYGVVREMVGHGIGAHMHEDPAVCNYGTEGTGMKLKEGMTLAIEPMINMGTYKIKLNGWDCRTEDGQPSAHYENTVLIKSDSVEILTMI